MPRTARSAARRWDPPDRCRQRGRLPRVRRRPATPPARKNRLPRRLSRRRDGPPANRGVRSRPGRGRPVRRSPSGGPKSRFFPRARPPARLRPMPRLLLLPRPRSRRSTRPGYRVPAPAWCANPHATSSSRGRARSHPPRRGRRAQDRRRPRGDGRVPTARARNRRLPVEAAGVRPPRGRSSPEAMAASAAIGSSESNRIAPS